MEVTKDMKKAVVDKDICVACGCCITLCKADAIIMHQDEYATVDIEKCEGCGMCARNCPVSAISAKEF